MAKKPGLEYAITAIVFIMAMCFFLFSSCGYDYGYDEGYDIGYETGTGEASWEASLEALKQMSKTPNKTILQYGDTWETEHFKITFSLNRDKPESEDNYDNGFDLIYDIDFLTQTLEESYQNRSVYFGIYSGDSLILKPDYEQYYFSILTSGKAERKYGGTGIEATYKTTDLGRIEVVIGIDNSLYVASVSESF